MDILQEVSMFVLFIFQNSLKHSVWNSQVHIDPIKNLQTFEKHEHTSPLTSEDPSKCFDYFGSNWPLLSNMQEMDAYLD